MFLHIYTFINTDHSVLFHFNSPQWIWEASLHKFLVDTMLGNQFATPRTKVLISVLL